MARGDSISGLPPGLVLVGYIPEERTQVTIHEDAAIHAQILALHDKLDRITDMIVSDRSSRQRGWLTKFLLWIGAMK